MSSPCHVEMFATLKASDVKKEKKSAGVVSKVQAARNRMRNRLRVGGDQ